VRGWLSPPFSYYRGTSAGPGYPGAAQCRQLPANWRRFVRDEAKSSALIERHIREQV
jgi:hypothetical protein